MNFLKVLLKKYRLLLVIGGFLLGGYYWLTNLISIEAIKAVPQATILRARNGEELFRFFEEDRRWIDYKNISPRMTKAIVATEDKSFRENNGTDMSSLARALWNNVQSLRSDVQMQGGSTLTQQLIKNVFLTKKKTISRKFQELILARHLTNTWTDRMQYDFHLSRRDAFQKAKEEILAAYLNVVYFGNHSYGIESAAKNYFGISAKELTLLQSVILASLPQAPSVYNPTQGSELVLGYRSVYSGEEISQFQGFHGDQSIVSQSGNNYQSGNIFMSILAQKPLVLGNDCLGNLEQRATINTGNIQAIYHRGRKDWVLCRMYELDMIEAGAIQSAFLDMQQLKFSRLRFPIKAPHFVFWVQRYLLQLPEFQGYDEQQLARAGLDITTTLDRTKQQQAEEAIANYMGSLRRLGGNNRSMLHIDPKDGSILSYVGSADFFDTKILGQNDMVQAKRQVGSTLKPFFYSYLFQHYPVTINGAVVDAPLKGQSINNHDMQFRAKITFAEALASSRNLPVVRIFLALGGDSTFIPYLQQLGFELNESMHYSYPLALGANEASMMQLAQAYMQLAHNDPKKVPKINPILSIKKIGNASISLHQSFVPKIIAETVADMIWNILSSKGYMPSDRYWLRNLPLEHVALKTGTTDKKIGKRGYPRDGRSVLYNADNLLLSWAGNTSGKEMGLKAFGGEINHYVIRQYLKSLQSSGVLLDRPRIPGTTHYHTGGRYAGVDHKDLSDEMINLLWRYDGNIPTTKETGDENSIDDGETIDTEDSRILVE